MKRELTYLRPETVAEAIAAFDQAQGKVAVLCGGAFDRSGLLDAELLLDLQDIKLTETPPDGTMFFGPSDALVALQEAFRLYPDFEQAAVAEAGLNVRNTLSLYNFLKTADGRSSLLIALCAMRVYLRWQPGNQMISLEDYLDNKHKDKPGFWDQMLIQIPKGFGFESVARTPLDKPIVAVAMTSLNNEIVRVAVGGSCALPVSNVFLDDVQEGKVWVRATFENTTDAWAGNTYRQEVAMVLYDRLIEKLNSGKKGGAI